MARHDNSGTDGAANRRVSRRQALAGGGALAVGGLGLLTLGGTSDPVRAEATMGDLVVSGDEATVGSPPARIDVAVTGEWAVEGPITPEMVRCVLQVHVNGVADDLASADVFDASEGTFSLGGDIYEHRDVTRGDLMPDQAGAARTTDVLVRVIVTAADEGEMVAETFVEKAVDVTLTAEGVTVSVGGEGSVSIVA